MKKILFLVFAAAIVSSPALAQKKYQIKGRLGKVSTPLKIFYSYRMGSDFIRDSVITEDGSFRFSGSVKFPVKANMYSKPVSDKEPFIGILREGIEQKTFFIEGGKISIKSTAGLKEAKITGGKVQEDYQVLQDRIKLMTDEMEVLAMQLGKYRKENKEDEIKQSLAKLRALRIEITKKEDQFVYDFPDSYVSLDLVKSKSSVIDVAKFEPFYKALSERIRNTEEGKIIGNKLAIAKKVDVGQPFINFTLNNTEGIPVSLASQKGKYLLVDFWASWCGPCRAENPNILKAYNRFKAKNFDVLAVSIDEKKDAWLKAIKDDGMPWIHVIDLAGWKSPVAAEYGITAIPQNFLLDPEGKIVAKNLRGEALEKKLEEILGK